MWDRGRGVLDFAGSLSAGLSGCGKGGRRVGKDRHSFFLISSLFWTSFVASSDFCFAGESSTDSNDSFCRFRRGRCILLDVQIAICICLLQY